MWRSTLAVGAVCSTLACSAAPTSPPTPIIGMWGGNHISLVVSAAGSQMEFDCAHGNTSSPLTLDDRDAFNTGGTFVREHAGPIVVGRESNGLQA